MLRYGEVFLKSEPVRREFTGILIRNCRQALRSMGLFPDVKTVRGRIFFLGDSPAKVAEVLSRIFGVVDVAVCTITPPEVRAVTEAAVLQATRAAGPGTRFAVRARREGVRGITSQELAAGIGSAVLLSCPGTRVDLENPDYEIFVELRESGGVVYDTRIPAPGGLPLGSQGKVLSLLSPGIDSPVASWLMMKRGCGILSFHVRFEEKDGKNTLSPTLRNLSLLSTWCRGFPLRLIVVDASPFFERIAGRVNPRFRCVLCKRFMVRLGSRIALREGIPALCTGDSLGQVASQTLPNMVVISQAAAIPILRPLIAFDKQEIVTLARRIGTFDERPGDLSCPYVPAMPATVSREEEIRSLEEGLNISALESGLIDQAEEYYALNGEILEERPGPE